MPRLKDPKIGMFSIILITDFPIFSGNQTFQSTALDDRFSPFSSIIIPSFKIIVRLSFHVCHQNLTAQSYPFLREVCFYLLFQGGSGFSRRLSLYHGVSLTFEEWYRRVVPSFFLFSPFSGFLPEKQKNRYPVSVHRYKSLTKWQLLQQTTMHLIVPYVASHFMLSISIFILIFLFF